MLPMARGIGGRINQEAPSFPQLCSFPSCKNHQAQECCQAVSMPLTSTHWWGGHAPSMSFRVHQPQRNQGLATYCNGCFQTSLSQNVQFTNMTITQSLILVSTESRLCQTMLFWTAWLSLQHPRKEFLPGYGNGRGPCLSELHIYVRENDPSATLLQENMVLFFPYCCWNIS